MPFAPVNGIQLHYEEHGPPDGIPLVLMHGGAGSLEDPEAGWTRLIPLLASEYRVFALEHRGHGRTGNPDPTLSYERIAADISAFVRTLGLAPVHFGGMSDGGIVGLFLALSDSAILRSMVCVGTNYRVDDGIRSFLATVFTPAAIEAEHPSWAADLARRHDPYHGPGYWKTLVEQIGALGASSPSFTEEQLRAITTPALFVAGEQDPFASAEQMIAFKRNVPQAEWLVVNDAWHTVQHTHADLVGPRILDFYRRH
jgi:pimeloyl-ACP methyl ester carboxylesterase